MSQHTDRQECLSYDGEKNTSTRKKRTSGARAAHAPRVALLMQASRQYERGLLRGIARYSEWQGPWEFYRTLPLIAGGGRIGIEDLKRWEPDGAIVREGPGAEHALALGIPLVYAPSTQPLEDVPNLLVDDAAVGRTAADHLAGCGLKHVAYCGMDNRYFWSRDRRDGFVEAAHSHSLAPHVYARSSRGMAIHWERELPALTEWITSLPTPVGMMVCTDDFSLLVTEACRAAGLRVPEDVALIGVGNDETICDLSIVSLTSIRLNTERGGYECAALLDRMMKGQTAPPTDIMIAPLDVQQRRSTDILAIDDPLMAQALQFIGEHATEPIHVDDVVQAVPLSRRALYNRFQSVMGEPLYAYIRRTRLDVFARMLVDTTLPVAHIADSLGYPDEKNVARQFRKVKGLTPLAYRRRYAAVGVAE